MSTQLLRKAVEIFGSQAKLAAACGVKQASIWQAIRSERCSAELAMSIERATAGAVIARDLRPDLPWPAVASSDAENSAEVSSCPAA